MPTFSAKMRVTHIETWDVEADSMREARKKLEKLTDDVLVDETCGEVVDWEIVIISSADKE